MIDSIKETMEKNGLSTVVVASRGGKSAIKLAEALGKGINVVSVSEFSYSDDAKKRMKKLKMTPIENADLIIQDNREASEVLLSYGTGVKAAIEVALIANEKKIAEKYLAVSGKKTVMLISTDELESKLTSDTDKATVKKFIDSSLIK